MLNDAGQGPAGPAGPAAPVPSTSIDNLNAAAKAADLDVPTAVAVAHTSTDPFQTAENAKAIATVAKTARIGNALQEAPPEVRSHITARLTAYTKDDEMPGRLTALGVPKSTVAADLTTALHGLPVPLVKSKPGGLFHDVIGGLDRARHDVAAVTSPSGDTDAKFLESVAGTGQEDLGVVLHPLGAVIPSAVRSGTHEVLGGINTAMGVIPHAYRASVLFNELNDPSFGKQSSLAIAWHDLTDPFEKSQGKYSFSLSHLAHVWDATENGETTYDPNVVSQMKATYSPEAFKLIQEVANGGDPAEIAQEWGNQADQVLAATKLPAFKSAVQQLTDSRMSPGRQLVGEQMFQKHPELANTLSGGADALVDWYVNPFVLGGSLLKAAKLSRFSLDANDLQTMYKTSGQVRNAMDFTAKAVNGDLVGGAKGAAGLAKAAPELLPLYDDLRPIIKNAADNGRPVNGEDIARWLSTQQGTTALLGGRAGRYFHGETMIPHMSALGTALREGKVAMGAVVNWAADDLGTIVKKVAPGYEAGAEREIGQVKRLTMSAAARVRRSVRLAPPTLSIADGDPNAIGQFRQWANMFLPAHSADNWTNAFANGNAGEKYLAIRGATAEIGNAFGDTENTDLGDFFASWLSSMEDDFNGGQHYLADGADRFGTGPTAIPVGLTLQDMSKVWHLPDPNAIDQLAKKTAVLGALRLRTGKAADEALRWWRIAILGRPGFTMRAAPEELGGAISRTGAAGLAQSYAARTATDLFKHQITESLPPEILANIKTPEEMQAAWLAFTRRAIKKGAAVVAGEDRLASAKLFMEHGNGRAMFGRYASSLHQAGAGYGDSVDALAQTTSRGEGATGIELRPGRDYTVTGPSDPFFHERWAMRMNRMRSDPLSATALDKASDGVAAQIKAVTGFLQADSPYMRDLRRLNQRSSQLPDGRLVGTGGVTQRMADRDWASKIVQQVNEQILSPSTGKPIVLGRTGNITVARRLLVDNIKPSTLQSIPREHLPLAVLGPEVIPYAKNWYEKLLSWPMENFIGKPMDYLSRQPIFFENYHLAAVQARKQLARFVPEATTDAEGVTRALTLEERTAHLDKLVDEVAAERAVNETLPYIHDVRSRTQFEQVHSKVFPFLFAQRQFYQRWGRTLVHSPEAIGRAATIMNGLRVSGFVHNDPQTGAAYFVYPGSGALNNVVSDAMRGLGVPAYMNVPSSFTGQVKALTPGLEGVVPGASPFISIGLSSLATLFPGVQSWANLASGGTQDTNPNKLAGLFGDIGSEVAPSIVTRFVSALQSNATGQGEMATAIINAMAYLSATGHGIPENATQPERDLYVTRLKTTATSMLLTKAAVGFILPAAPQLNTDSLGLDNELLKLLNTMPYDQAIAAFLRANPDGLPYTIGKTASPSGAQMPTTSAGLTYMNAHLPFLKQYKYAAPWLIPQSVGKGPYDQAAENAQLLQGLRQKRAPTADSLDPLVSSWYSELVYAQDSTEYFNVEQDYLKASSAPGADYTADKAIWDKWKGEYLNTHPALKAVMATAIPAQRRTEVMTEMQQALTAPDLPKSPTTTAIKGLMDEFQKYQDYIEHFVAGGATLPGQGTKLYDATNAFSNWAVQYAQENPAAAPFWSGVLQYEMTW